MSKTQNIKEHGRHGSRNILCQEQVVSIFLLKSHSEKSDAAKVARQYGVSDKTVRDIWTGRTWYRATIALEPSRTDADERLMRHIGRPKGSRDLKPRKRRDQFVKGLDTAVASMPVWTSPAISPSPNIQTFFEGRSNSTVLAGQHCESKNLSDCCGISEHQNKVNHIPQSFFFEINTSSVQLDPFHDDWPYWSSHQSEAPSA